MMNITQERSSSFQTLELPQTNPISSPPTISDFSEKRNASGTLPTPPSNCTRPGSEMTINPIFYPGESQSATQEDSLLSFPRHYPLYQPPISHGVSLSFPPLTVNNLSTNPM